MRSRQGNLVTITTVMRVQRTLQAREGGEPLVATPAGFVDLVTAHDVVEIRQVSDWQSGLKVLVYAPYFPGRKPRLHLFGGYTKDVRTFVEQALEQLGVMATWEQEPY